MQMRQHLGSILLLVPTCAVILFAAGCHSDAPIPARAEQFDTPWLTVSSPQLRQGTMVGTPTKFVDESGLLHIGVPVRNTTDLQLYVQYEVHFFNRNGLQTGVPATGTITIPTRAAVIINAASTSPADGPIPFRMELRYPRVN